MQAIFQIVASLSDAYPHTKVTKGTLMAYAEALADVPPDALRLAVRALIASSRYFPTVAEIRSQVISASPPQLCSPGDAWREVLNQARKVGARGEPSFSHRAISDAVAECGGWRSVCLEDEVWTRKKFMEVYPSIVREVQKRRAIASPAQSRELTDGSR